jgi:hypothetical protein
VVPLVTRNQAAADIKVVVKLIDKMDSQTCRELWATLRTTSTIPNRGDDPDLAERRWPHSDCVENLDPDANHGHHGKVIVNTDTSATARHAMRKRKRPAEAGRLC